MSKHVAFWIGVFAAGLVIMPVALGIWAVAQGFAQDIAVSLFIIIAVLVFLLVVVLFLRGPILRRLVGRGEATLEEVSSSLISGVSAAVRGDVAKAEAEADTLARAALGWYAWSSFYRWVIATALGLLLAFASFTGTVLLFEQLEKLERQTAVMDDQRELMEAQTAFMESQTARIEEQTAQAAMQNEILTLNLVNQLRSQMLATVDEVRLGDVWGSESESSPSSAFLQPFNGESCRLGLNSNFALKTPPSKSTLSAISLLGQNPQLSDRILSALRVLLLDRNDAVAIGATVVLDDLGFGVRRQLYQREIPRRFSAIYAQNLELWSHSVVSFDNSVVNVTCAFCFFDARGSITNMLHGSARMDQLNKVVAENLNAYPLFSAEDSFSPSGTGGIVWGLEALQHDEDFESSDLKYIWGTATENATRHNRVRGVFPEGTKHCEALQTMASRSRLFDYEAEIEAPEE